MKKKILKKFLYFKNELSRMETANNYAPFPIYDTDDLKRYRKKIDKMEEDLEKVECCSNCKSLFLVDDDFNNTWCGKCNTPNLIEVCSSIEEYLEKYKDIWT